MFRGNFLPSELLVADLLGLSARFIDEGVYEGPGAINRITTELSEVAEGIAVIEAFSHVIAFRTGDGLAIFDTSLAAFAGGILRSLRRWTEEPVHTVAYTHGHIDHVGGAQAFLDDARERGAPRPRIVGHENVLDRFARYRATNGYNAIINARQFGGNRLLGESASDAAPRFGPVSWVQPDTTFRERMSVRVGELMFELRHSRGETDDHLWAWVPQHRALCAGDFVTWVFPNAGNPQKVQRYPLEWAAALREMAALEAELLLPAHGLPIAGVGRIRRVLDDVATVLESLVSQCLALMNEGASLDELIHQVALPDDLMAKPYLQPVYDEPEFVVRNVWRCYGGWYDGNPARLKPPPDSLLAREIAGLAGGVELLVKRALELAEDGELRLACALVEAATQASPEDRSAHAARAEIYRRRRQSELSLMAKGIYGFAERESEAIARAAAPPLKRSD
jgi:alkyl sulfatase BDS1-like metallo-beta-lactamase superfamily hydrolase